VTIPVAVRRKGHTIPLNEVCIDGGWTNQASYLAKPRCITPLLARVPTRTELPSLEESGLTVPLQVPFDARLHRCAPTAHASAESTGTMGLGALKRLPLIDSISTENLVKVLRGPWYVVHILHLCPHPSVYQGAGRSNPCSIQGVFVAKRAKGWAGPEHATMWQSVPSARNPGLARRGRVVKLAGSMAGT